MGRHVTVIGDWSSSTPATFIPTSTIFQLWQVSPFSFIRDVQVKSNMIDQFDCAWRVFGLHFSYSASFQDCRIAFASVNYCFRKYTLTMKWMNRGPDRSELQAGTWYIAASLVFTGTRIKGVLVQNIPLIDFTDLTVVFTDIYPAVERSHLKSQLNMLISESIIGCQTALT